MKREDVAAGLAVGAALGVLAESLGVNGAVSYWGPRSPVIVGFALVTAVLWGTRLRPWLGLAASGVALLWLLVAFTPLTSWMARDIVRRDRLRDADAVVVLASRLQADGELTAPAQSRLVHGLELLAEGRAKRLVLTESAPPSRTYAEPARALMRSLNVEAELIAVGPVTSTRDEALAVARLFAERGLHSLILVTSPTHTRRAAATFEKQGLIVIVSPAVETLFDLETLDNPDDRLRAFGSLLHERLGLWLYAWRGDIAR